MRRVAELTGNLVIDIEEEWVNGYRESWTSRINACARRAPPLPTRARFLLRGHQTYVPQCRTTSPAVSATGVVKAVAGSGRKLCNEQERHGSALE